MEGLNELKSFVQGERAELQIDGPRR